MAGKKDLTPEEIAAKRDRIRRRIESTSNSSAEEGRDMKTVAQMMAGFPDDLLVNVSAMSVWTQTGAQVHGGGMRGARVINAGAAERHREWQAMANDVWSRRPTWSKRRVAAEIAEISGANRETIRRYIERCEPSG